MAGVGGIEFLPNGTTRSDDVGGTVTWTDVPVAGVSATVTKGALSRAVIINGMGRVFITGR
jgi:hypothetical protein